MANILNLALKKEIFEGLLKQTNNEIPIEKSNWWKKRLMDLDTGRFKPFDTVKASCGSSEKYDFPILKIEDRKDQYVVTVSFESELLKPVKVNPIKITDEDSVIQENTKTVEEIQKEINIKFLKDIKKELETDTNVTTKIPINEVYKESNENNSWFERVHQLFTNFYSYENVYVVSTPNVIIRTNGQVVSTNRKIFMKRDYDMEIPFSDMEFTKRNNMTGDEFYNQLYEYLSELLKGNLIFVKKGSFAHLKRSSGEDTFIIKMAYKRNYMFR